MRLDKYLANAGRGTRTEIKKAIAKGYVTVNGTVAKDPGLKISEDDMIAIDGEDVECTEYLYFYIDKPECVLTAMEDQRLPNIGDFIPDNLRNRKLSPVGRLDYHTTGLLVITNDGTLSHKITSPRHDLSKTYLVTFRGGKLTDEHVKIFAEGFDLTDKEERTTLKPSVLELIDDNTCRLTISEGKTHQVKRMLAKFGCEVTALRRLSVGPLKLPDDMKPGVLTRIPEDALEELKKACGLLT